MSRTCPKCRLALDDQAFSWKIKGIKRSVYCRACSNEYVRNHYSNNKGYYIAKAKKRGQLFREEARKYLGDYLSSHPCIDCGENDIFVLEFDHRNRSEKIGDISSILRKGTLSRVIEEVAKCDIRCANCHRKKTERENKSWKNNYAPIA